MSLHPNDLAERTATRVDAIDETSPGPVSFGAGAYLVRR
jgi:hypothetical protein